MRSAAVVERHTPPRTMLTLTQLTLTITVRVALTLSTLIGRVSYLIYVSMRHYVLTTSGDIVVCFHAAMCLSC